MWWEVGSINFYSFNRNIFSFYGIDKIGIIKNISFNSNFKYRNSSIRNILSFNYFNESNNTSYNLKKYFKQKHIVSYLYKQNFLNNLLKHIYNRDLAGKSKSIIRNNFIRNEYTKIYSKYLENNKIIRNKNFMGNSINYKNILKNAINSILGNRFSLKKYDIFYGTNNNIIDSSLIYNKYKFRNMSKYILEDKILIEKQENNNKNLTLQNIFKERLEKTKDLDYDYIFEKIKEMIFEEMIFMIDID